MTVIDTAGIRETEDPLEQEGVRRTRARAAEADCSTEQFNESGARAALTQGACSGCSRPEAMPKGITIWRLFHFSSAF